MIVTAVLWGKVLILITVTRSVTVTDDFQGNKIAAVGSSKS